MRVRIIRAEMQARSQLSVFNAMIDGAESVVGYGGDNQPRTTSTGALVSVKMSAEQNNTFSRDIRGGKWAFLSRDGSIHPMHPTVTRIQLHNRAYGGNVIRPIPREIVDEPIPVEILNGGIPVNLI